MSTMPASSMGIGMDTKSVPVTIEIPVWDLRSVTDEYLAMYWHVAQANPAPYNDRPAGELVQRIGNEIVRRWLAAAPVEVHKHQEGSHYHSMLCAMGKWSGPNREFELDPTTPQFQAALAKMNGSETQP